MDPTENRIRENQERDISWSFMFNYACILSCVKRGHNSMFRYLSLKKKKKKKSEKALASSKAYYIVFYPFLISYHTSQFPYLQFKNNLRNTFMSFNTYLIFV